MVITGDREQPICQTTMPVVIVLDRLRSAFNTGNIFRLADAVRAESVVTCGYTPSPPHPKLEKTARGCQLTVSSKSMKNAAQAVMDFKAGGYTVYGVETSQDAACIWDIDFGFPAVFIFGNEALGIEDTALALSDCRIALPCLGYKNSINVGNCAAIVLYEALRQWQTLSKRKKNT